MQNFVQKDTLSYTGLLALLSFSMGGHTYLINKGIPKYLCNYITIQILLWGLYFLVKQIVLESIHFKQIVRGEIEKQSFKIISIVILVFYALYGFHIIQQDFSNQNHIHPVISILLQLLLSFLIVVKIIVILGAVWQIQIIQKQQQVEYFLKDLQSISSSQKPSSKHIRIFRKKYSDLIDKVGIQQFELEYFDKYREVIIEKLQECQICYEKIYESESIWNIGCQHIFHKLCLIPWIKKFPRCPFCKISLRMQILKNTIKQFKINQ